MTKGKLSDRQRRMVDFIQKWTAQNGYPPSIREIGEAVGISSTSVVNYNLNRLVEEGYLGRDQNVSRGIRLT
ncbi:MAG: LexA family protein, partial [Anaerolineales bacterium]